MASGEFCVSRQASINLLNAAFEIKTLKWIMETGELKKKNKKQKIEQKDSYA